jgi:hypothetical protein
MRIMRLLIVFAALALLLANAGTPDPASQRLFKKEPRYQSHSPGYCLLLFGPDAKTRVWLVLDGDRLFADRRRGRRVPRPE